MGQTRAVDSWFPTAAKLRCVLIGATSSSNSWRLKTAQKSIDKIEFCLSNLIIANPNSAEKFSDNERWIVNRSNNNNNLPDMTKNTKSDYVSIVQINKNPQVSNTIKLYALLLNIN